MHESFFESFIRSQREFLNWKLHCRRYGTVFRWSC